jgi:glycosyltransferase involved in cell wall biosynthesis
MIKLSIVIPTYNRENELSQCLQSVIDSAQGHEDHIEIIISDNASNDGTFDKCKKFVRDNKIIIYNRWDENKGSEMNFYYSSHLANGEYLWILGDDDIIEKQAVGSILASITKGYNLIMLNYSVWDSTMNTKKRDRYFSYKKNIVLKGRDIVLSNFGTKMDFVSACVVRTDGYLTLSEEVYKKFSYFKVSHMLAVYNYLTDTSVSVVLSDPCLLKYRSLNDSYSGNTDWYTIFVYGSKIVYYELIKKGYSLRAVKAANMITLRDFVLGNIVFEHKLKNISLDIVQKVLMLEYKGLYFWLCIFVSVLPRQVVRFVVAFLKMIFRK